MKTIAYIILVIVIVIQIGIGYSIKTGGSWIQSILNTSSKSSESRSEVNTASQDVLSSPMVPYTKSNLGLSFSYPGVWPIMTKDEDRRLDSSLVDSFGSQDDRDGFYEGFYVNHFPVPTDGMEGYFNVLRGNLVYQKLHIVSEIDRQIAGLKGYVWVYEGTVPSVKQNDPEISTRWILYIIEKGNTLYTFEFSDQIQTFDTNVKKMEELVASINIK
ncbi:MAG: hypothetical protein RIQ72_130 [Candidatus Parcubacteria bacterium]|jgi:hypothetical protein